MKKYKFKAQIQPGDGGGAFIFFPFNVEKAFGTKGKVPVCTTFDGEPYTGSIFRYGYPQHILGVLKGIRDKIGKQPGDYIEVVLWKDEDARVVEVPPKSKKRVLKKKVKR